MMLESLGLAVNILILSVHHQSVAIREPHVQDLYRREFRPANFASLDATLNSNCRLEDVPKHCRPSHSSSSSRGRLVLIYAHLIPLQTALTSD